MECSDKNMNRVRVQTQYHTQGDGDDRRVLGGLKFSVQGIFFFWGGGGGGGGGLT